MTGLDRFSFFFCFLRSVFVFVFLFFFKTYFRWQQEEELQLNRGNHDLKTMMVFHFFIIRLPSEFLPMSGALTRLCASTLGPARLCSSRAGSWFGAWITYKLFLTPSGIRTWVFSLQLCLNIVYNSNCSATMASHNDGWIGCKKKWWPKQNRNKTNIKKSKNYPRFNSLRMAKRNSDQSIKIALY